MRTLTDRQHCPGAPSLRSGLPSARRARRCTRSPEHAFAHFRPRTPLTPDTPHVLPGHTRKIGSTGRYCTAGNCLNRYLDPSTGQFLTVDPLVAQTMQPYQYAGDNPVNASDPTGMSWWGAITHHWRGIVQGAIVVTAVAVSIASVGTLSGASLVLAGAVIGSLSSEASYYAGCVGTDSGCSVTGALIATLSGGIAGGASAGLGGAFCESSLCLSAIGMSSGAGVGVGGYVADSALEHTCRTGSGEAGAGAGGLGGASLNQSDWGRLWGGIKHAFAGGSGGGE